MAPDLLKKVMTYFKTELFREFPPATPMLTITIRKHVEWAHKFIKSWNSRDGKNKPLLFWK